jgi:pyridoxine kinase
MSRVLAISSQVAYGYLGLSAAVPALQALGHDVMALPTVLLSNEPGDRPSAGQRIAPAVLADIAEAL